ncbi:MAG: hypothetical protein P4L84_32385 [Isosphaeraceae bacterium]|nr:hypothetical protein [Isosphaeraceae bacterium]
MNSTSWGEKLRDLFLSDPLMGLAIGAAAVALASTPIAFAVLGRLSWFKARRGRVMQRPEFSSIVAAMVLVMGIPAIFLALTVKSRHFDEDRYAFDPNKTWSVLEQGRQYQDVQEADHAVKAEMARLAEERKNLVDTVKKLDEAMLKLRAVAGTSPAVAQAVPAVLQRLAAVRQSIALDGPQQLMDFTAPPVELAALPANPAPAPAPAAAAVAVAPSAPAPAAGEGLTKAAATAEIATVPAPQQPLAAMLPLTELPAGWTVGKSGDKHLETFNADNLFEKIDGRAESFIQYDVKGMAYAYYHPTGDESNEVQVYIFEMANSLKALGKYGSEKPDEAKPLAVGTDGYTASGSTLFYSGPYYTQIVSTQDDPKFAKFAQDMAKRIAAQQVPAAAAPGATPESVQATPEGLFALLPAQPSKSGAKYVAQDVFGYSFLSDVFMADYQQGTNSWQGFLRPYPDAKTAQAVFDQYVEDAKKNGAEVKAIEAEGADRMVLSSNVGLNDAFFVKGNALGGANGAADAKQAEAFARAFVKGLPAKVPIVPTGK